MLIGIGVAVGIVAGIALALLAVQVFCATGVGKARRLLGYDPEWTAREGLADALPWYENSTARHLSSGHHNVRRAI